MKLCKDAAVSESLIECIRVLSVRVEVRLANRYFEAPEMTPIEQITYFALLGYEGGLILKNVSYQVPVGPYRCDFIVRIISHNILENVVVECDGHDYHEKTKEQAQHDKKRDRFLQDAGYKVYRFTGSEIWKTRGACVLDALGIKIMEQF